MLAEESARRPLRPRAALVVLAATLIVVATGCVGSGPPRIVPVPGGVGFEGGVRLGWETKRISTKEPPATQVADDGTVCRVSPDRYRGTDARALVYCDWQLGAPPTGSDAPKKPAR